MQQTAGHEKSCLRTASRAPRPASLSPPPAFWAAPTSSPPSARLWKPTYPNSAWHLQSSDDPDFYALPSSLPLLTPCRGCWSQIQAPAPSPVAVSFTGSLYSGGERASSSDCQSCRSLLCRSPMPLKGSQVFLCPFNGPLTHKHGHHGLNASGPWAAISSNLPSSPRKCVTSLSFTDEETESQRGLRDLDSLQNPAWDKSPGFRDLLI